VFLSLIRPPYNFSYSFLFPLFIDPPRGGRDSCQSCGLDFVSKLAEGSVYAWLREFLVKSFIVLA
jgi:hypothetical protein